jgi:hypothetical protein
MLHLKYKELEEGISEARQILNYITAKRNGKT